MGAFQDRLQKDLMDVWFNQKEFGETHVVNGKAVRCFFDSDKLSRSHAPSKSSRYLYTDSVYTDTLAMYTPADSFGAAPKAGASLLIDNKHRYRVQDVNDEGGLLIITLEVIR